MLSFKKRKTICFCSVAIPLTVITLLRVQIGFTDGSSVWSHFAFQFCHANIMHLGGNLLCLWFVLTDRWYSYAEQMIFSITAAFTASYASSMALPTLGFSGDVLALIGIMTPMIWSRRNALTIIATLALGFVVHGVNGWIHLWCYVLGLLYALIRNGYVYDKIMDLYEKTSKKNQGMV